jgi:thioredoxin-related protein
MKKFYPVLLGGLLTISSLSAVITTNYSDPYRDSQGYYLSTPSNTPPPSNTNYYQPRNVPQQQPQRPAYQQMSVSNTINWTTSYSDASAKANAQRKPIVILFTGTNWCPACMKLEREVLNQPEFARAIGNRFIFLKAEFPDYSESGMASSPYRNLMERYNIEAFPTFVVVNGSGVQLGTVNYQAGGPSSYTQQLMSIVR